MYGPTETTVMCSGGKILPGTNPRHIGKPIAGYNVSIRNTRMQDVPLGAQGEIVIGERAARGYKTTRQDPRAFYYRSPS